MIGTMTPPPVFLSTPSARRATEPDHERAYIHPISIHALREEGDPRRSTYAATGEGFLSTPSARRATSLCAVESDCKRNFYPRPPRGGRLRFIFTRKFFHFISIHALREEGDPRITPVLNWQSLFLSTPSARRATLLHIFSHSSGSYFYPRPPRGGRPFARMCNVMAKDISIHALREEGDSKNREKTPCFCLIIHLSAQIAKRCLQTKPQNHTVTCANGWYSGAKRPGKPCVLPIRTGRTSKDQHAVLGKFWVQSNVLDLGLVVVA